MQQHSYLVSKKRMYCYELDHGGLKLHNSYRMHYSSLVKGRVYSSKSSSYKPHLHISIQTFKAT